MAKIQEQDQETGSWLLTFVDLGSHSGSAAFVIGNMAEKPKIGRS